MKLLFVINPISGGKVKNDWEKAIRNYFSERDHSIEIYLLTGKDDKRSVQHYIDQIKPDRVVAVGGDGTVKMLADIVKETPVPLGIIPAGSANGMAKELSIPLEIEPALQIITEGQVRKIDLIRINEEELCIHLSDIGLNAMLVKYFEQSENRGMWGYGRAIFRVLWEKQKLRVTITTDQGTIKRMAYMVALANARKYGTGANINPDGDVSDGAFEIVIIRKLNVYEIIKAIFTDRSFHPKKIEVVKTKNVDMQIHRKAYFQVDGEYRGKTTSVSARILPQIISVMVPDIPAV
ncbi:MAG TPA: diacylglycerol kinase family protein [Flavisolibacter sp.]|nr:diacylglycerol kinase family protein [Flavisolibacter sp.]